MKILLSLIAKRSGKPTGPFGELTELYKERAARLAEVELRTFPAEAGLLSFVEAAATRTRPMLVLGDSRGRQVSSEELAAVLGRIRDSGTQLLVLAIGPANGWSADARARADHSIAFGRITLPHELAAVVLAEQTYRALTILAGHPYHSGH